MLPLAQLLSGAGLLPEPPERTWVRCGCTQRDRRGTNRGRRCGSGWTDLEGLRPSLEQRRFETRHIRVALMLRHTHRPQHHLGNVRRNGRIDVVRGLERVVLGGHTLRHRRWLAPSQQMVQGRAQAVEIAPRISAPPFAAELFHRRIGQRPKAAHRLPRRLGALLEQTEVHQLNLLGMGQPNVGRLDVTVQDRPRLSMQVAQHVTKLQRIIKHQRRRQRATPANEQHLKILTCDQLHHQIALALMLKPSMVARQVRVMQILKGRKLVLKTANTRRVEGRLERQSRPRALPMFGGVDRPITPVADQFANTIIPHNGIAIMKLQRKP